MDDDSDSDGGALSIYLNSRPLHAS